MIVLKKYFNDSNRYPYEIFFKDYQVGCFIKVSNVVYNKSKSKAAFILRFDVAGAGAWYLVFMKKIKNNWSLYKYKNIVQTMYYLRNKNELEYYEKETNNPKESK